MDGWIAFGIDWIVRFQAMGDWLVAPMKFFSFLGSEDFFLFVLPFVYWCVDAGLGLRVGLILLTSNSLNDIFKMAMHGPRPYWVSTAVKGMAVETSFGVPSGHSQIAVGVWGVIANRIGRTWSWVAAGTVVVLIGFSRMYLGVHFPHDVLLGWALGGLTLWAFLAFWDPIAERVKKMSLSGQIVSAFVVSLVMIVLAWLVIFLSRGYILPAEWVANATRNGGEAPDPLTLSGAFTAAGTLFGLCAGVAWIGTQGGYQVSGPVVKRALRYIVGFIGVAVLYFGLKMVFPDGEDLVALVFRYTRYMLVGLWISAGAPKVFARLQIG